MSKPTRWRITSGTLDCIAEGETCVEAFLAAVREHMPESLGEIFIALREGETDEMEERYGATIKILEEAGLMAPGDIAPPHRK